MDKDRYQFFLDRYRAMSPDELDEIASRRSTLTVEAIQALDELLGPPAAVSVDPPAQQPERSELAISHVQEQTKLSRELWNGGWSFLCAGQFMMALAALPQVFRLGMLVVLIFSAAGLWVGRKVTKTICAADDKTILVKRTELKNLSLWMWPVIFAAHFLANALASSR
jgi:hypothetical protein